MPDRETLRHTKWDGKYHGVAAASVGQCAVSALAQKKCFVTPDVCYAPPWRATFVCATSQGSFVAPMRIGPEACVMHHDASTRAMPSDALHTAAWKAAACATRYATARLKP